MASEPGRGSNIALPIDVAGTSPDALDRVLTVLGMVIIRRVHVPRTS